MAVAAIAPSAAQVAGARQSVVARKSFSGVAVLPKATRPSLCRINRNINASAEKREQTLAMPAALTVAAGAALSSPLAAQAAVTPSLKNLINSVIAGGVVLVLIVAAVTAVSGFDPVARK
ncbi:hypothetical protein CVIRNUC_007946 [Coccomyxa viridis]|uniref:Photosystem II subunit X n=1 Tax=Coccomyxa viridis TaxID=1274662 RepID=A0AAV1IC95_9CHLO|nr:hypothetical protein CVIRNUC_007946 [Coccomyxa viridis]